MRRGGARGRRVAEARRAVKIVSVKSTANSSLGSSTGTTRVAWTVIGRLPVVQCVRVRRSGNVLSGVSVRLLDAQRADRKRRRLLES